LHWGGGKGEIQLEDLMKKILVVDDEGGIRTAISVALKERGYEMIEAENGMEAFEIAWAERPDLIISDVMMDNGNGFLLRELLQVDGRTSNIPMILMTGAASGAGAWKSDPDVTYLLKPFGAEKLLSTVEQALT